MGALCSKCDLANTLTRSTRPVGPDRARSQLRSRRAVCTAPGSMGVSMADHSFCAALAVGIALTLAVPRNRGPLAPRITSAAKDTMHVQRKERNNNHCSFDSIHSFLVLMKACFRVEHGHEP